MRRQLLIAATLAALGTLSTNAMAGYTSQDGKTTVGGKMYGDLTYQHQTGNTKSNGIGVDLKRFYLSVGHRYNDLWSVHLTTDVTSDTYPNKKRDTHLFVKTAYVQAKFSPLATVRLGSANMPWIPYDEHLYGFRYVEHTLIDRLGFGHSADWGAHLLGKEGMFNYAISAVNGGGYHNWTRTKTVDVGGRVGIEPLPGLNLAVGGYVGKLGKNNGPAATHHTATRLDLVAAYVQPAYRVGFEYFKADNWNAVTNSSSSSAYGISAWGSVSPMRHITLFTRFDYAKPSQDVSPSPTDYYFNVGAQYQAYKNVLLALAFKHQKHDHSTIGTRNEVGLWTQVKF